jgi:hypothetical protein
MGVFKAAGGFAVRFLRQLCSVEYEFSAPCSQCRGNCGAKGVRQFENHMEKISHQCTTYGI